MVSQKQPWCPRSQFKASGMVSLEPYRDAAGDVMRVLQLGAYPLASGSWSLNNCGTESSARPTRRRT
jgi:hypothetical protein